ncbi:MAG: diguanylate cyclase [Pseudomonadota bacterium]|nr:diguanylate cyclase [Pseudomonadota bacterium]
MNKVSRPERRHEGTYAWAALLCIGLTVGLVVVAFVHDLKERDRFFRIEAQSLFQGLSQNVTRTEALLESLTALVDSAGDAHRDQMAGFARTLLAHAPQIDTIAYQLRITDADLPQLRHWLQVPGYPDVQMRSIDPRLADSDVHYPVVLLEPARPDTLQLLGTDSRTHPLLRPAIDAALVSGKAVATAPLDLIRGGRGYLLVQSVTEATQAQGTPRHLVWLVTLAVRAERLLPNPAGILRAGRIRLHHAGFDLDDPRGRLMDTGLPPAATGSVLRLVYSRVLSHSQQPLLLHLEIYPGLGVLDRETLGATLGFAALLSLLIMAFARLRAVRQRERRLAEETLRQSEARYRLLAENASDMISSHSPDGRWLYVSPACQALLGYRSGEMAAQPLSHYVHPDDARDLIRFHTTLLNLDVTVAVTMRMRHKLGHYLWLEMASRTLRDPHSGEAREFISVTRDVSAHKSTEERLLQLASHDALTGLPNRLLFQDRLNHALIQARRRQKKVAVLFIDLDNLKTVNDTLGHAVGDRLLQAVALRISGCLRQDDTVARLGGDEFAVILEGILTDDDVVRVTESLLDAIRQPLLLEEGQAATSASIGIILYPDSLQEPERLLLHADSAMYQAKRRGRNTYQFFIPEQEAAVEPFVPPQRRTAAEKN